MGIKKNEKYDILTYNGWCHFEGIAHNGAKLGRQFEFDNGNTISATYDHYFKINGERVKCESITIGTKFNDTNVVSRILENVPVDAYDILAVDNDDNSFKANEIESYNCDELAFVNRRIALEFWTSVFPTLSCLSGDTYVLNSVDGYRRIDSYLDENVHYEPGNYYKVFNEDVWGLDGVEELSHLYVSPESDTLKITTKSGFKVEATLNHPIFVQYRGMVEANNLHVGDKVMVNYGMDCFGKVVVDIESSPDIDIDGYIRSDICLQFTKKTSEQLITRVFRDSGELCFKDYSVVYRLKLILSNLGYKCNIWSYGEVHHIDFEYVRGSSIEYEEINSIVKSSQPYTFDFTVPSSHSFLQNGIIGSNTGGSCIITSTPTDDETLFAHIWKDAERTYDENGIENPDGVGINGFKALRVKWDAHPERDESFKVLNIRQFGEEKFQREHELEFVAEAETLLSPLFLKTMESVDPLYTTEHNVRWFKEPSTDYMYFISLDPSMGTGGDNAAIQVFEFPTMVQVAEWMHNKSDPSIQIRVLLGILNGFKKAEFDEDNIWWTFENNGCGETVNMYLREVEDETEIFGTLIKEPANKNTGRRPRKGLLTTNMVKNKAFSRMKLWIERGVMKINSKPLIKEFKTFVRSGATYRAMLGEKDDLVLSTMLIARMIEKAMGERDEYMEELGVAKEIVRLSEGSDDDDDQYFPLPVG